MFYHSEFIAVEVIPEVMLGDQDSVTVENFFILFIMLTAEISPSLIMIYFI